ncbi:hypothetical protein [Dactylosporangium sp. CA-233914]|uniref:hypothetical protein n=1 Tax=Dactylosporangium sp. CA-233914 TaxID=3239934 RepID=UPI003D94D078
MKVAWDVREAQPPVPSRSVVDGDPAAVPVTLRVFGRGRREIFVRIRRVRLPLTEAQAAEFRRFERLVRVFWNVEAAYIVALVGLVAGAMLGVLPASVLPAAFPVLFALALVLVAFRLFSRPLRPRQYPILPVAWPRGTFLVEVREVWPSVAQEWRLMAGNRVEVID